MTSHKHAEMIKAKADNMELVLLANGAENAGDNDWFEYGNDGDYFPTLYDDCEYFLCLTQHKEACLHWLNGGDVDYQDFPTSEWLVIHNRGVCSWGLDVVFMQEEFNIRIKPHKEKL